MHVCVCVCDTMATSLVGAAATNPKPLTQHMVWQGVAVSLRVSMCAHVYIHTRGKAHTRTHVCVCACVVPLQAHTTASRKESNKLVVWGAEIAVLAGLLHL